MIALQQEGAPLEGFLRYVLSNPEPFTNEGDLRQKVAQLVRDRGWTPEYSRNLVVSELIESEPHGYRDHAGAPPEQMVWQAKIENRRPDVAAVAAVCILDRIQTQDGMLVELKDRTPLKWAGQRGYECTILPKDFGIIDLLAISMKTGGIFLRSLMDVIPREPIVSRNGDYEFFFKVFSQGFPLVEFAVRLNLQWTPSKQNQWSVASPSLSGRIQDGIAH